ncbi:hypothetical protein Trydic_g5816 [Trypoxylus dichotomus]
MNITGDSGTIRCSCEDRSLESDAESPTPKETKKSKLSLSSLALNLRRGKSLNKRTKKSQSNYSSDSDSTSASNANSQTNSPSSSSSSSPSSNGGIGASNSSSGSSKKSTKWPLKFYCGRKEQRTVSPVRQESQNQSCCKCTCYKRTEEHQAVADVVLPSEEEAEEVPQVQESNVSTNDEVPIVEPPVVAEENNVVPEPVPPPQPPTPIVNVINVEDLPPPENNMHREGEPVEGNGRNRLAHIFVTPNFIDLHW